jgi:hypothetical protein
MEIRVGRLIEEGIQNPERAAGFLLVAAFLIPIVLLIGLALRGSLSDVFAQIGGAGRDPFVRKVSLSSWMIASLLSLAGYIVVANLLEDRGEKLLSNLALTAMILATLMLVLESTIHLAFGAWASDELQRTGSEPALYRVIFQWSSVILQRVYVPIGYIGLMLYGWAFLSTSWLPAWCGWLSIGWGGAMFGLLLLTGTTLPATLLIPGTALGLFLLTQA